jgi:hypothetical protein
MHAYKSKNLHQEEVLVLEWAQVSVLVWDLEWDQVLVLEWVLVWDLELDQVSVLEWAQV